MYRAIIFDFFDVIRTDSYIAWMKRHGYERTGPFLEASQLQDRGDIGMHEFFQRLSDASGQSKEKIMEEMEQGAVIDHDVLALIERLRAHYKLGLLSNAPSDFLRTILRDHDLEKYFDDIVISSEVGLIKPHPEIFHHMLDHMGVRPSEAIFIDDNPENITGAKQVGIAGIVHTNAANLEKELNKLAVTLS